MGVSGVKPVIVPVNRPVFVLVKIDVSAAAPGIPDAPGRINEPDRDQQPDG
jgi:hypothetical protein